MNVAPDRSALLAAHPAGVAPPARRARVLAQRIGNAALGKVATLLLAAAALGVSIATFVLIVHGTPLSLGPGLGVGLVLANVSVLLLLGLVLAGRLTRVWVERRRGSAGARLHVQLVLLFSGVAVAPTIVVAVFAVVFFHFGIQSWFNDPVRAALDQSLQASRGYLEEHRNNIRAVALEMGNDLTRAGHILAADPAAFADVLGTQTTLRGLTEAVIFEPVTGQVMASAGIFAGVGSEATPSWVTERARAGEVVVLNDEDGAGVRAVVELESTPPLMLLIGRPVDPSILAYMNHTEAAVAEYRRLDENRSWLQITFAWIFAVVALLVLSAAVLIGLVMANQIARPIGRLIHAAERVRGGDLDVRVPEVRTQDEIAGLSRAFNRMTGQLAAQRTELMDAYSQIDDRRRFTETVLSGVSAGVIGLDAQGCIELPNRAARELLDTDLLAAVGHPLGEIVPEFSRLVAEARSAPERAHTAEVQIGPPTRRRTLLLRIGADLTGGRTDGFVATFDDITELQSAQRKAAWTDVARRIAHEIKNPLTPIQLSAERLKRRFAREITSDPETFAQCADTIVRSVADIARLVDEFSNFARMPLPVIRPEDVSRIAREALILQKTARPQIAWTTEIPDVGPIVPCDRRLIGQALTNLLQNAADAVAMRPGAGHIRLAVQTIDASVRLSVSDDGIGLPSENRAKLTEPYVTHKPKGTGLGLAIVKKIMEDHGGDVLLEDRVGGPGTVATLILPMAILQAAGVAQSNAAPDSTTPACSPPACSSPAHSSAGQT